MIRIDDAGDRERVQAALKMLRTAHQARAAAAEREGDIDNASYYRHEDDAVAKIEAQIEP